MTQSNHKVNYGNDIDRISDLPGNVIDCILQHMIVKDLVKTSILSRKWRYMWTSVPRFKFGEEFYELFDNLDNPAHEFSRIITEILFLHNGPINEFILYLPRNPKHKITFEYHNKWFLFLSRKGVKHIFLDNDEGVHVRTPSHLFSCQGLTYLYFFYFNLSIPPSFCGFKTLLQLHLLFITFESGALESLLPGCPLLEKLAIELCSGYECIDISSSTLTHLTVSIEENCIFRFNRSLPILQRLDVELVCEQMLYAHANIFPLSQLINLKYLSLDYVILDERKELLYIISILKSASNLVEIVIQTYYGIGYENQAPDPSEKLECSCCCLSKLGEVKIVVRSRSQHALSLARFILANSSSLKTLTFELPYEMQSDARIMLNISQDLLLMERASQKAQVKLTHS
ncbi:F-box/FBD/LRR-repeat protein At1g13570-like [Vicia villosa]|uniref:F-box/FBD/LRR-repeat protein At1g13570-like n=1 Tax=Vicia villosa TaxID=3911 RepID=UPI00273A8C41|nr:F-box/FBD/LRR-repeat protein At1g13570-like [Vicia villosa]